MITIYGLADPRTNVIRYVGKAQNLKHRIQNHLCPAALDGKTHRAQWLNSLMKIGLRPIVITLENVDESVWEERERWWIKHYRELGNDLTNFTDGGEGGATYGRLGKPWTGQQRESYKKTRTGMSIKATPEAVKARSEANKRAWEQKRLLGIKKKGPVHTEEAKAAISKAHSGKKLTEEHKEKLRQAKLGKKQSPETIAKRLAWRNKKA